MKTWRIWVLGILCGAIAGCEEPTGIVPAAPPGVELPRQLPANEAEEPQALGEQAVKEGTDRSTLKAEAEKIPLAEPTAKGETKTTKTGVEYETLQQGTGPMARGGQSVMVHYTGKLEDGTVFDTSRSIDRTPYSFIIGISPVIKGWWYGIAGMRVGERRKLIIPPDMGYGALAHGPIPAKSTLIFEVELLSAK
jgi:FKBP-type peptidyl-prolyl cis-trans isomerase